MHLWWIFTAGLAAVIQVWVPPKSGRTAKGFGIWNGRSFWIRWTPLSETEDKGSWVLDQEASENIVRLNEAARRLRARMKIPANAYIACAKRKSAEIGWRAL